MDDTKSTGWIVHVPKINSLSMYGLFCRPLPELSKKKETTPLS
jgi:hypothetical protein